MDGRGSDSRSVLLLTQVVPFPLDSGPKIKTHFVLRYLAQRFQVHLMSFVRNSEEEANARALDQYCDGVTTVPLRRSAITDVGYLARSLTSGRPYLVERDDRPEMRRAVQLVLQSRPFHAVHADQLSMAQFAVDARVPLRILDEHNAVWTIVKRGAQHERWVGRRAVAELEWRKLRSYEGEICARFDRVVVVSDQDRAALEAAAGRHLPNAATIPIAIDTATLAFEPRSNEARDVLSVATMFYPPNVEGVLWFAEEVFPLVRRSVPDTRFLIVGSRPPNRVASLAQPGSRIVVTGYVPDLEPILRQSAVLVVPVHAGSGMRVKILEAFARGVPVVSTTIGVEGIPAEPGKHLLVADDPDSFSAAVAQLITEPAKARQIAQTARAFVEQCYDWRTALRGLDAVYGS